MITIQTQKALVLPAEGGKYTVGEAPVPHPGPKEVLVKVLAAALNPIDWKITVPPLTAFIPEYPFITGTDGAGVVVQVGDEVSNFKEGDRVLFQGWFANPYATFQQYCVASADITALIPENISFDQAASVPVALGTVILSLYNQHPDYPKTLRFKPVWEEGGTTEYAGKPALIIGGASSVGQYAIQVAKLAGFSPIITTASPHNAPLLASLGATHVLSRALPPSAVLTQLPGITGGTPLEFAFDAVSLPETMALAYEALAPGGALALTQTDEIPTALKAEGDARGKRVVHVFGNVHAPPNRACGVELYKRLTEWLEKGLIKPNPVELLPAGLAGALEGLERLEHNRVSGKKLIVRPQETA
ncbi:GroES-like protein [Trametes polyzona]|nr:GroES-like protein [Trametes polyzona]